MLQDHCCCCNTGEEKDQGASKDVPDAEQASVAKAETADAGSTDEDVDRDARSEISRCACAGHLSSFKQVPNTAHLYLKQSCIAVLMDKLLLPLTLSCVSVCSSCMSYMQLCGAQH